MNTCSAFQIHCLASLICGGLLQVYAIAMEKGDLIAVRGTPAARVGKSDHMLTVPPWRTFTLLQLVDVQDTNLQRLLKRTKATSTCDPKTGYSCILFIFFSCRSLIFPFLLEK